MSLLDELANPPAKALTFRAWLVEQPAELQDALAAAAVDRRWTNHALEQLLRKHHAPCSEQSIGPWRIELGYTG